jgi:hypothetical protein
VAPGRTEDSAKASIGFNNEQSANCLTLADVQIRLPMGCRDLGAGMLRPFSSATYK